jgi:hypothetical protein
MGGDGRFIQCQLRRPVVVALDEQCGAVRREPAGQVGGVVGDQPGQLLAGKVVPCHGSELAVIAGAEDQGGTVRCPGQRAVHGRRVRRGHQDQLLAVRRDGQVDKSDIVGGRSDGRSDCQRKPPAIGGDNGFFEPVIAKVDGPLGTVGQVTDHRVEGDPVPAIGQVADPAGRHVSERMDIPRVTHQRLQVGLGRSAFPWQPEQR